jgi:hypothetical protein
LANAAVAAELSRDARGPGALDALGREKVRNKNLRSGNERTQCPETTRQPENLIFEYFLLPLHAFPWVQVVNSLLMVDSEIFPIVLWSHLKKFFAHSA